MSQPLNPSTVVPLTTDLIGFVLTQTSAFRHFRSGQRSRLGFQPNTYQPLSNPVILTRALPCVKPSISFLCRSAKTPGMNTQLESERRTESGAWIAVAMLVALTLGIAIGTCIPESEAAADSTGTATGTTLVLPPASAPYPEKLHAARVFLQWWDGHPPNLIKAVADIETGDRPGPKGVPGCVFYPRTGDGDCGRQQVHIKNLYGPSGRTSSWVLKQDLPNMAASSFLLRHSREYCTAHPTRKSCTITPYGGYNRRSKDWSRKFLRQMQVLSGPADQI